MFILTSSRKATSESRVLHEKLRNITSTKLNKYLGCLISNINCTNKELTNQKTQLKTLNKRNKRKRLVCWLVVLFSPHALFQRLYIVTQSTALNKQTSYRFIKTPKHTVTRVPRPHQRRPGNRGEAPARH